MDERPAGDANQTGVYYEEAVIFYHWLYSCTPRPIAYPLNEGLWIKVCSWGLRPVLESLLLEREYQRWMRYRASARQQLGERFLADPACALLHRSTDEQVSESRRHWDL